LRETSERRLIRLLLRINDPQFSDALVDSFLEVAEQA